MQPHNKFGLVLAITLSALSAPATALNFDFLNLPITVNANSVSFTTGGITATVSGFHVEFDSGTSTIYGPFSTDTAFTGSGDNVPYFGRPTNTTTGNASFGLNLVALQDLGQTDRDAFNPVQPGFDNAANPLNALPSIQFALFSFDTPVDITEIIVDDVSNFDRNIWAAGGATAPNLSGDLSSAFSGYTLVNSSDDSSLGPFTHTLASPMQNISYLAVGTPTTSSVGSFAGITSADGVQFYINSLTATPSAVPVPAALPLLASAIGGLGIIMGWCRKRQQ